jgi:hypothetical protein
LLKHTTAPDWDHIQNELAAEDDQLAKFGTPINDVGPAAFIQMGLDIEEKQ